MSGPYWALRRSAEEREARRMGLTIRSEEQLDTAVHEESYAAQYGDSMEERFTKWEPEQRQTPGTPGRNCLPTIDDDPDQDPHVFPRSYPAWGPGETFVTTGLLGPADAPNPRGLRRFEKRSLARAWALEKYGHIFEEMPVKNRYAFRVPMPGPAGAKHRPGGK